MTTVFRRSCAVSFSSVLTETKSYLWTGDTFRWFSCIEVFIYRRLTFLLTCCSQQTLGGCCCSSYFILPFKYNLLDQWSRLKQLINRKIHCRSFIKQKCQILTDLSLLNVIICCFCAVFVSISWIFLEFGQSVMRVARMCTFTFN